MSVWWRSMVMPGSALRNANIRKNDKGVGMRGEQVVLTKVTRPRIPLIYPRAELYGLLDELSATPLIKVSALPGSGKTTLMSSYIESRKIPCLWYQVDRDDGDLATFFYHFRIAALRINPHNKIPLPKVSTERAFRAGFWAKEFFQTLYRWLESPFIIVLDNYHALPRDAALHPNRWMPESYHQG